MNPFELDAPAFVVFYAALIALVTAGVWLRWRLMEPGGTAEIDDPLLIAHLRGGADEALQLTAWSMLARGALKREGDKLVVAGGAVEGPLETTVHLAFREPRLWRALRSDAARASCASLRDPLVSMGLLVSPRQLIARIVTAAAAVVILVGTCAVRDPWRDRTQPWFGFMMVLILAGMAAPIVASIGRVPRGVRTLSALVKSHSARRASVAGRPATDPDLRTLAAVYGLGALPDHLAGLRDVFFTPVPVTPVMPDAAEWGGEIAQDPRSSDS